MSTRVDPPGEPAAGDEDVADDPRSPRAARIASSAVTRADVAREAGTSVAVVSYVINDGPRRVAPATRDRVLRAIRNLGYAPHPAAQALASGRSGAYGLIVPDISNPFFAALAHAIQDVGGESGNVLMLGDSAESKSRETELIRMFAHRRVDGLLFVGVDDTPDVQAALQAGIRVVLLDRRDPCDEVSSVAVDNAAGAREATRHLADHGYQDIGIIRGPQHLSTASQRADGWREAMAATGLDLREAWQVTAPFTRVGGRRAARAMLDSGPPEALFVSNEQQAIGVLAAAAENGMRVPDQLALITFDGTEESEFSVPSVSTVAQPLDELAERALETLARSTTEPRHITCGYSLQIRASCGDHTGAAQTDPARRPRVRPLAK